MGFLFQVLKDVSEKQPYSVGKAKLNEAVEMLKERLPTGREGFKVIAQVAGKVREYNESVRDSNDKVKKPIDTLLGHVNENFKTEVSNILKDNAVSGTTMIVKTGDVDAAKQAVDDVNVKLMKALQASVAFTETTKTLQTEIADLNFDTRNNVNNAIYNMKRELDVLQYACQNWSVDMRSILKNVSENFSELNDKVSAEAKTYVHTLAYDLQKKLTYFKNDIEKGPKKVFANWLLTDKTTLESAAGKVRGDIQNISVQYKLVNTELVKIKRIVQTGDMPTGPRKLEELVTAISTSVTSVGQDLEGHVQSLGAWKSEAGRAVTTAMEKVSLIVKVLDNTSDGYLRGKVMLAAFTLKQKATKLMEAITKAKESLTSTVNLAKKGVTALDISLKKDLRTAKQGIASKLATFGQQVWTAVEDMGIDTAQNPWGSTGSSGSLKGLDKLSPALTEHMKTFGVHLKTLSTQKSNNLASFLEVFLHRLQEYKSSHPSGSPSFSELKEALQKDLADKIKEILEKEIGADDLVGDRKVVISSDTNAFVEYKAQVKQPVTSTADPQGTLADTIATIGTDVGEKLNVKDGISVVPIQQKNIDDALVAVTEALTVFTDAVKEHVQSGKNNASLNAYLTDLNAIINGADVNKYALKARYTQNSSPVLGLAKINDNIGNLKLTELSGSSGRIHGAITTVSVQVTGLENASKLTNNPDHNIMKLISSLPKDMETLVASIRAVLHVIRSADDGMGQWISAVGKYIETIDQTRDQYVKQLQSYVKMAVSYAQNIITIDISRRYVRFTKLLLAAFADKVTEELAELPAEIDADLTIGFKGLMKTLEDGDTKPETEKGKNFKAFKELVTKFESTGYTPGNFKNLSDKFMDFWKPLASYVNKQIIKVYDDEKNKNPAGTPAHNYSQNLLTIYDTFNELVIHIKSANRYDHILPKLLDKVDSALSNLKPDGFAKPSSPVIDGLLAGLGKFGSELKKVYISAYDRERFEGDLIENPNEPEKSKLTKEGRNCANVFLTSLELLINGLGTLRRDCQTKWKDKKICLYETDKQTQKPVNNSLGQWFQRRGYGVSGEIDKQQGELRNHAKCTSEQLIALLISNSGDKHVFKNSDPKQDRGPLGRLISHLDTYWSVCQLRHIEKPTTPSTVRDMLHWLAGLKWHPLLRPLFLCCKELFKKPEKPEDITNSKKYKSAAYPQEVTYPDVAYALNDVSLYAQNLLIAIMGHGQEDGRYATEYRINPDDLLYPSRPSDCFDMLVDILNRVYHQLCFLLHQCQNPRTKGGWADCQYGRYVGGSRWRCNEKQCLNQMCNQKASQTRDQIHEQHGDQHPTCGIKSPLQSFLEDGLPGFLPHTFTKPGCKWECTLSNHKGIPCKTPMGFADISIAASLTQNGAHLKNALEQFCGKSSALNKLCSMLTCVLRQPPQTLGDMFAFYSGFFYMWSGAGIAHKQTAFTAAVAEAIFGQEYMDLDPTTLFRSSKHSAAETSHARGDLHSLASCEGGNGILDPVGTCGPYLHPISGDIYDVFSSSNKKLYLSWIVYLTETFYDLLYKLLEDCKSKCAVPKSRCYQKSCIENCRAVLSSTESPSLNHDAQCKSIVECDYTLPNLFKYGFTFESPHKLIGGDKAATKRTCQDFCKALGKVLDKEIHLDRAFAKLIYVTIPDYMWAIRLPFFWTTVALWSLSLFYLICVMVGRLDVLHIRSHLRIPSSHKITAQSLLAAAQVGRLAKISYLQP